MRRGEERRVDESMKEDTEGHEPFDEPKESTRSPAEAALALRSSREAPGQEPTDRGLVPAQRTRAQIRHQRAARPARRQLGCSGRRCGPARARRELREVWSRSAGSAQGAMETGR